MIKRIRHRDKRWKKIERNRLKAKGERQEEWLDWWEITF